MTQLASCRCGQLKATVAGDSVRVSVCHCLNCKKRSGSAFAVQARWPKEDVAIDEISSVVEKDPAITAKLLKLVNSAFFGLRQQVSSLNEVVNYLGMDTLKALVLSINAFSQFEKKSLGG